MSSGLVPSIVATITEPDGLSSLSEISTDDGFVISTIPYIFYNYTREQHDQYVAEIEEREKANSNSNEIEDASNTEAKPVLEEVEA